MMWPPEKEATSQSATATIQERGPRPRAHLRMSILSSVTRYTGMSVLKTQEARVKEPLIQQMVRMDVGTRSLMMSLLSPLLLLLALPLLLLLLLLLLLSLLLPLPPRRLLLLCCSAAAAPRGVEGEACSLLVEGGGRGEGEDGRIHVGESRLESPSPTP